MYTYVILQKKLYIKFFFLPTDKIIFVYLLNVVHQDYSVFSTDGKF